jgi:hypothetical protein
VACIYPSRKEGTVRTHVNKHYQLHITVDEVTSRLEFARWERATKVMTALLGSFVAIFILFIAFHWRSEIDWPCSAADAIASKSSHQLSNLDSN